MFADTNAIDCGFDAFIIRASDLLLRIADSLRIKRVQRAHATTKPDRNDMLRFAIQRCFGVQWLLERSGCGQCGAGSNKVSAMHLIANLCDSLEYRLQPAVAVRPKPGDFGYLLNSTA